MNATPIKRLREQLGMSQDRFAQLLGKSYGSVRGYEAGRQPPPEVMTRMLSLAMAHEFKDLADELEASGAALGSETSLADSADSAPASNEDKRRARRCLEYLLDMGNQATVDAIVFTLEAWQDRLNRKL